MSHEFVNKAPLADWSIFLKLLLQKFMGNWNLFLLGTQIQPISPPGGVCVFQSAWLLCPRMLRVQSLIWEITKWRLRQRIDLSEGVREWETETTRHSPHRPAAINNARINLYNRERMLDPPTSECATLLHRLHVRMCSAANTSVNTTVIAST